MEWIIPIAALGGSILGWLTFWLRFSDRLTRAESTATDALQTAAEAKEDIKASDARITTVQAGFSLYRESAIEKFVMHDTIAGVERRLVDAQTKSEQRLTDAITGMTERFDRFIEAAIRNQPGR